MPKKSRKEKILADIRRQEMTKSLETPPAFRLEVKRDVVKEPQIQKSQQNTELLAIKRDLYKTCILASLAIAVELVIYWFRR